MNQSQSFDLSKIQAFLVKYKKLLLALVAIVILGLFAYIFQIFLHTANSQPSTNNPKSSNSSSLNFNCATVNSTDDRCQNSPKSKSPVVTDFVSCKQASGIILESYPAKCVYQAKVYLEVVNQASSSAAIDSSLSNSTNNNPKTNSNAINTTNWLNYYSGDYSLRFKYPTDFQEAKIADNTNSTTIFGASKLNTTNEIATITYFRQNSVGSTNQSTSNQFHIQIIKQKDYQPFTNFINQEKANLQAESKIKYQKSVDASQAYDKTTYIGGQLGLTLIGYNDDSYQRTYVPYPDDSRNILVITKIKADSSFDKIFEAILNNFEFTIQTSKTSQHSGFIEGSLSYPEEPIPQQTICATDIVTNTPYCTSENIATSNNLSYHLEVPAGRYFVSAKVQPKLNRPSTGNYSKFVTCDVKTDSRCNSPEYHQTMLIVNVAEGQTVNNINPVDWYIAN